MDQVKIGKYIAAKRKALGLTQRELAEALNMSDKSVSKWERGVCLPDVSVYLQLCEILGITINEFLAGEDISSENIVQKSEDNLISLTKDTNVKTTRLKRIIALLLAVIIICASVFTTVTLVKYVTREDYIAPFDKDSIQMKTANLLSGVDHAFMFEYLTREEYNSLEMFVSEYRRGEFVSKETVVHMAYEGLESSESGIIAIVPDYKNRKVKVIVGDEYAKLSTEFDILKDSDESASFGRSNLYIQDDLEINYDEEQQLATIIYGEKGVDTVWGIEDIEKTPQGYNDYVYFITFKFGK